MSEKCLLFVDENVYLKNDVVLYFLRQTDFGGQWNFDIII
jgi:hypothetical protein